MDPQFKVPSENRKAGLNTHKMYIIILGLMKGLACKEDGLKLNNDTTAKCQVSRISINTSKHPVSINFGITIEYANRTNEAQCKLRAFTMCSSPVTSPVELVLHVVTV